MTRRRKLLVWASGLCALLSVGCLTSHNTNDPASTTTKTNPPSPRIANSRPPEAAPPTVAPSPYTGAAGSVPPITASAVVSGKTPGVLVANSPPAPPQPPAEATLVAPPISDKLPEPKEPAPEEPLIKALREALTKHPKEARELLAGEVTPTDKLVLALLRLTAVVSEDHLEGISLEEAEKLLRRLRRRAPLKLGTVCFCRQITGFGRYEALPADHAFEAGVDNRPGECVRIYAEVRNFSCRPHNGEFETVLASTLEITNQEGPPHVVTIEPGTCTDHSQTPREDYSFNFQFHIPVSLTPGRYALRVTIKDITPLADGEKTTARTDSHRLYFTVKPAVSSEVASR